MAVQADGRSYPGGVQYGTFGHTLVAMRVEREDMPATVRPVRLPEPGVTSGGYLAWVRDYVCGESGIPRTNYGRVTVQFDGIIEPGASGTGTGPGTCAGVLNVLQYFDVVGVTLSGDDGINAQTALSVVVGGPVNVVNTGRYRIYPGEKVYLLLPTYKNEEAHRYPRSAFRKDVTDAKVAILVGESVMNEIYQESQGISFNRCHSAESHEPTETCTYGWLQFEGKRLFTGFSFVGSAITGCDGGQFFQMLLKY